MFDPSHGRMEAQLAGQWTSDDRLSANLAEFRDPSSESAAIPKAGGFSGNYDPLQDVIKGTWWTDAETSDEFCWVKVATRSAGAHAPAKVNATEPEERHARYRKLFRVYGSASVSAREHSCSHRDWPIMAAGLLAAIVFGFLMASYLANN